MTGGTRGTRKKVQCNRFFPQRMAATLTKERPYSGRERNFCTIRKGARSFDKPMRGPRVTPPGEGTCIERRGGFQVGGGARGRDHATPKGVG